MTPLAAALKEQSVKSMQLKMASNHNPQARNDQVMYLVPDKQYFDQSVKSDEEMTPLTAALNPTSSYGGDR